MRRVLPQTLRLIINTHLSLERVIGSFLGREILQARKDGLRRKLRMYTLGPGTKQILNDYLLMNE